MFFEAGVGDVEDGDEELVGWERGGTEFDFLEDAIAGAHGAGPWLAAAPDAFPPFVEELVGLVLRGSEAALEPCVHGSAFSGAEAEHESVLGVGVEEVGHLAEDDDAEGGGFGDGLEGRASGGGGGSVGGDARGSGQAEAFALGMGGWERGSEPVECGVGRVGGLQCGTGVAWPEGLGCEGIVGGSEEFLEAGPCGVAAFRGDEGVPEEGLAGGDGGAGEEGVSRAFRDSSGSVDGDERGGCRRF